MGRRSLLGITAASLLLAGTLARPVAAGAAAPTIAAPGQYYLSLGDSLAFGYQGARIAAEAKATGTVDPTHFNTGYSDDYLHMLQAIDPGIQLVNLGCPGQTSGGALTVNGCPTYPFPLHYGYTGTQLQAALDFIKAHPGQVGVITVALGANDINNLITKCGGLGASGLGCVAQALPALLAALGQNLAQILGALRQADPTANIQVLQLFNPYEVDVPSSSALAAAFNKVIAQVAAATGVTPVDVYTTFNQSSTEPQTLCALTAFCTAAKDIHPTDLGYLTIAQLLWKASGYATLAHGFIAGFVSANPGQGYVFFGSGPGCNGLVEVSTRDLTPNSNVHIVYVTGNDLPGTVGDNGIIPGVTYWYSTVTVSPSAIEQDNNAGKCYSVTASGL